MANYIFAYYGEPQFTSQEDGKNYQTKWIAWQNGLGDAFVDLSPMQKPTTVTANGISESTAPVRLTGFAVVKADNLDAAIGMAKSCPHLEYGTIDVAEKWEM